MLKSMTAFGRAQITIPQARFVVEIQSVNRKYLEIQLSLPKELWRFDTKFRQWISEKVHRGVLSAKVTAFFEQGEPLLVRPNIPLAKQLKEAFAQIAKEVGAEANVGLSMVARHPDILLYEDNSQDDSVYLEALGEAFSSALDELVSMKVREGKALQEEIAKRLENIRNAVDELAKMTSGAVEKYQTKLKERIEEVLPGNVENEERILREVCLFADRIAIAEEIARLRSHLDQCEDLMNEQEEGLGKTIEFLTQELHREANTIGSKVTEIDATRLVVKMKGEIEKIRQQVQNVE